MLSEKEILQIKLTNRIELIKLAKSQMESAPDKAGSKFWERVVIDLSNEKWELLGKIQALSSQLEVKA